MIERQELECTECGQYVHFDIDTSLDGNHVLDCPNCGHRHYRLVRRGRITDIRWHAGQASYLAFNLTSQSTSIFSLMSGGGQQNGSIQRQGGDFLGLAWLRNGHGQ